MKRTPLRRVTPLRQGTQLRRKTTLARSTSGRARPDEPLAVWCEAQIDGVCTGRAVHRHHVRRRGQGGGDDRSNTRDVCDACHAFVHANPAWAYEAGLLARSSA